MDRGNFLKFHYFRFSDLVQTVESGWGLLDARTRPRVGQREHGAVSVKRSTLASQPSQVPRQFQSVWMGHFAPLAVASVDDPFDPMAATKGNVVPLYRGHGMHVRFEGLEPIVSLRQ